MHSIFSRSLHAHALGCGNLWLSQVTVVWSSNRSISHLLDQLQDESVTTWIELGLLHL